MIVGRKFKYRSPYGGLSNWTGTVVDVFNMDYVEGNPLAKVWSVNIVKYITSDSGQPYKLSEIKLLSGN